MILSNRCWRQKKKEKKISSLMLSNLFLVLFLFLQLTSPALPVASQSGLGTGFWAEESIPWPRRVYQSGMVGVKLTAKAAGVVDFSSGRYLFSQNIDQQLPIASLTKLMTALVFLENNPGWQKEVVMKRQDEVAPAKYIYRGEKVKVKDLFMVSLIASDNNATMALVRSTGLPIQEFVAKMNKKARELGMDSTSFTDVTGLTAKNVSTVRDLLILGKVVWQQADILDAASRQSYLLPTASKQRKVISTNKLFGSFMKVEAGKTGYTEEAGYCFFAKLKNQAGDEILAIVLGSESEASRFQEVKTLAWWTFNNFIWPHQYEK